MIWDRYRKCDQYLAETGVYANSDNYWKMYAGDQWLGKEYLDKMPVKNFIKPIINYKISTICQNIMTATYLGDGREEVYKKIDKMFADEWEKSNMDTLVWKVVKNAAVCGDGYIYLGDNSYKNAQVIPNNMLLLGNEQNPNIQEQPYIMIRERLLVSEAKALAEENGSKEKDQIVNDSDEDYIVGNKNDINYSDGEGKCTVVKYMEKRDGTVWFGIATATATIRELSPMQSMKGDGTDMYGQKYYPIANMIWNDYPNSARGRGETCEHMSNQIIVNQNEARRMIALKNVSLPKLLYMKTLIDAKELDKVGGKIAITNNAGGLTANQIVGYIAGQELPTGIKNFTDDTVADSRQLAGAGDATVGQVDPNRVSGTAITALQQAASLSLNEQVAKYKQLIEDIARIRFDTWLTMQKEGLEIGEEVLPYEELVSLMPDVRVDVSENSVWSKQAYQGRIDELLRNGNIDINMWTQLLLDDGAVPKNKFLAVVGNQEEPDELS